MERKAPLFPISRNKRALKAPESGTPRAGNQLVRMRSQYHTLKDMETGTAPTLALSNTDTGNTAETQETGGRTRPPVFSCSQIDRSSPSPKKPMPRRASKRQQSPRGPICPIPQPIGGGLRRRGQNLWPRLAPFPSDCPRFARAGPPASPPSITPPFTTKSHLRFMVADYV